MSHSPPGKEQELASYNRDSISVDHVHGCIDVDVRAVVLCEGAELSGGSAHDYDGLYLFGIRLWMFGLLCLSQYRLFNVAGNTPSQRVSYNIREV